MVHGALIGVKKNDATLLQRASVIGTVFCTLFSTISLWVILTCGLRCFRFWWVTLYDAGACFWAALHAWKLKGRVERGEKLLRPSSEIPQVAEGQAEGMPAPIGMDGVVMGRALTEAPDVPTG